MNVAFWIIVVVFLVLVWFLAGSFFKCFGEVLCSLWNEAKDGLADEDEDDNSIPEATNEQKREEDRK